jgi:hypothetical protein
VVVYTTVCLPSVRNAATRVSTSSTSPSLVPRCQRPPRRTTDRQWQLRADVQGPGDRPPDQSPETRTHLHASTHHATTPGCAKHFDTLRTRVDIAAPLRRRPVVTQATCPHATLFDPRARRCRRLVGLRRAHVGAGDSAERIHAAITNVASLRSTARRAHRVGRDRSPSRGAPASAAMSVDRANLGPTVGIPAPRRTRACASGPSARTWISVRAPRRGGAPREHRHPHAIEATGIGCPARGWSPSSLPSSRWTPTVARG